MGLKASVLGASGYAGGELLRLLEQHPAVTAVALGARGAAGADKEVVHPHLRGGPPVLVDITTAARCGADVCFSCMPSGALAPVIGEIDAPVIVDLSDDHRGDPGWVYGLTELALRGLPGATRIANPGCYPTATLLALVPFLAEGLIDGPVIIDAMSGVSGAGKGLDDAMSFSALHGSVSAYGSTTHRHVPEIERGLESFAGTAVIVTFTPHLVPMARGLLVTARAPLAGPIDDAQALDVLHDSYDEEPFVSITAGWPVTKAVVGTNRALVSARVDRRAGYLIVSAAIDNLGKGAAGQAIQNANVALGLEQTSGLEQIAVWP